MTLTQLNYILAVERCQNFGEAARECFVTQPTLSMQIQKLEDYLQITIFDRSKNPISVTPQGKKVLSYAREIMKHSHALEQMVKSLRGEVAGEYILAIIPTLAPYVLPLFVENFSKNFPKVDLKIFEYQTNEIIQYLKDGKIDGAILATPLEEKELKEVHLFDEPLNIFFSKYHPLLKKNEVDQKDLSLEAAWLLKEGHCLRSQVVQLCELRKHVKGRHLYFEAASLETVINLVKSSNGFTILPYLSCTYLTTADQDQLRPFKGQIPVREISFVTGKFSIKEAIDKALIKTIEGHLPKELKKTSKKYQVIAIQ